MVTSTKPRVVFLTYSRSCHDGSGSTQPSIMGSTRTPRDHTGLSLLWHPLPASDGFEFTNHNSATSDNMQATRCLRCVFQKPVAPNELGEMVSGRPTHSSRGYSANFPLQPTCWRRTSCGVCQAACARSRLQGQALGWKPRLAEHAEDVAVARHCRVCQIATSAACSRTLKGAVS